MISIIICQRTQILPVELTSNIQQTIGCDYEIVGIDNSNNQYSIFSAYNKGVRRAKGDILCFMHDDILFQSNNWGTLVENLFKKNGGIGAVGVAGGHLMYNCPCSWWNSEITSMHIFTENAFGQLDESIHNEYAGEKTSIEIASIDGLWMCIRGSLFDTISFDDKTFSGFHCYDSDICMQILMAGYQIEVSFEIDILHRGKGNLNEQYYHSIELWHKKWQNKLPVARGISITEDELNIHQHYAVKMYEYQKEIVYLYKRLRSPEYRIGHFLLKPLRFIKRKLK